MMMGSELVWRLCVLGWTDDSGLLVSQPFLATFALCLLLVGVSAAMPWWWLGGCPSRDEQTHVRLVALGFVVVSSVSLCGGCMLTMAADAMRGLIALGPAGMGLWLAGEVLVQVPDVSK